MNTQNVIDHLEQGLPMNARLKREIVRRLRSYKFNEDCANSSLQIQLADAEQRVKALEKALREIEWSNNSEWQSDRAKEALEDIC